MVKTPTYKYFRLRVSLICINIFQIYQGMVRVFANLAVLVGFLSFFCKSYNIYTIFEQHLYFRDQVTGSHNKNDSYSEHILSLNSIKYSILEYLQSTDWQTVGHLKKTDERLARSVALCCRWGAIVGLSNSE